MNGKNEDDDVKKGLKGIFGFLGAPKRQALSAEDEIKDFVADSDDLLDDEKRMIHEILDLGDMGRRRDHDAARGYDLGGGYRNRAPGGGPHDRNGLFAPSGVPRGYRPHRRRGPL